jgi:hypothetical protein
MPLDWVRQNPAIATALIATGGALFGALIAAAAKFVFDFYLSEKIKRRWKTIDTKRQYSLQIIKAADDLAGRISNMSRHLADGAATTWLRPLSNEEIPNIPFRRYYFSSTLYLFCRLVAWIEILKREQILLDFASFKETRTFNSYLELIYSVISYSALTSVEAERKEKNHWIYYHYLGGIGESLFVKEGSEANLRCLTFHEFCTRYKQGSNSDFRSWISEGERLFVDLSSRQEDFRWQRLQMLWLCLDRFLDFADPKRLRTTRGRLLPSDVTESLRQSLTKQAEWHQISI